MPCAAVLCNGIALVVTLLTVTTPVLASATTAKATAFDVAVYGATPAGVMAAVAAARMNRSVVLLASSDHIGGMVSSGLSHTDIIRPDDIDNSLFVGGVALEFFHLNTAWYAGDSAEESIIWDVEPHVAGILFRQMLDGANVTVVLNATVASTTTTAVSRITSSPDNNLTTIVSIRDTSDREFAAAMWVDASYEGDLLASAGVSFALGRESSAEYNESLAGFTGGSSPQFGTYIDPYDENGALLPLVDALSPELAVGDEDTAISSYNFRLCITNNASNLVPFEPPVRYNSSDWKLLWRAHAAFDTGKNSATRSKPFLSPPLPGGNSKFDLNSGGPLGTDFVGTMYDSLPSVAWAQANFTTRAMMWQQHKDYVQGLLWFEQTEFGEHKGFGLCKDEFVDTGHWPPQLYVREARRMRGERILGQRDVVEQQADIGAEAIGIGGYVFDTHTARRYACTLSPPDRPAQCTTPAGSRVGAVPLNVSGYAWDESHMVSDPGLFQLPRSLLLPQRAEVTNLAVPTAVSASHVAFSSIRMEPQWMVLGHAAGVLVTLALGETEAMSIAVQDVPPAQLNRALREQGARLDLPAIPQSASCVLNRCVPHDNEGTHDSVSCQFCKGLAENEWLAPVADFAPADQSSINVTALRTTALRKALIANTTSDKPVAAGYSCGRAYLQSFRGVWICVV